jgi:hypothetical protein
MIDKRLADQLLELSQAFEEIGITPVICGGLGIYLCFHRHSTEQLRVTNDIDLMLTKSQIIEQSQRNAIAEIIIEGLHYTVCDGSEHFRFFKEPDQRLDILAPRVDDIETDIFRIKLVKSKLHGHLTDEACFIEEDMKTIALSDILQGEKTAADLKVAVPSPTNQLILKLCAFDDRNQDQKQDTERAQAHAWDIYTIITLSDREDYLEGQRFLSRHKNSDIVQKVELIVTANFSSVDKDGWLRVLETSAFYPDLNIQQKRNMLDEAKRRLVRWFSV